MKKIKHEAELVKEALAVGARYMASRGVGEIEGTDSAKDKVEVVYRLLVHDKLIQPLDKNHEDGQHMRHKLALWISRQLPADHPLLH